MNVPACPMPIHQTKLTMAKPQATGMLIPHTPTPRISTQESDARRTMTPANAARKPIHQKREWGLSSGRSLICRVTEASVCPGARRARLVSARCERVGLVTRRSPVVRASSSRGTSSAAGC